MSAVRMPLCVVCVLCVYVSTSPIWLKHCDTIHYGYLMRSHIDVFVWQLDGMGAGALNAYSRELFQLYRLLITNNVRHKKIFDWNVSGKKSARPIQFWNVFFFRNLYFEMDRKWLWQWEYKRSNVRRIAYSEIVYVPKMFIIYNEIWIRNQKCLSVAVNVCVWRRELVRRLKCVMYSAHIYIYTHIQVQCVHNSGIQCA